MEYPRHGDPDPGVLDLVACGSAPALRVGSTVVAKKATGVCEAGEVGVVYEEYRFHERAGWGVIFEGGRHDSFNAREIDACLAVTGEVCEEVAGYAFEDARRLAEDFGGGRFAAAFSMARPRAGG